MIVDQQKPSWLTPEVEARIARAEYEYHVRVFGEEMARVNRMPLQQRLAYIHEMVDRAIERGVEFEKPALGVTP